MDCPPCARRYDNCLVDYAFHQGVATVDTTRTVHAIHQTDRDGNKAGHKVCALAGQRCLLGRVLFTRAYAVILLSRLLGRVLFTHAYAVILLSRLLGRVLFTPNACAAML